GISFLIVLMNSLVYLFLFNKDSKPRLKIQVIELLIFIVLMGSVLSYGKSRLSDYDGKDGVSDPLRVAIIQANIDQSVKWNPDYQGKTLVKYLELTRSIYWYDPHLIVWPETALPFFFQDHTGLTEMVDSIGRESGAYMIFGSPAYARIDDKVLYYNRAYNLSPMGQVVDYYDKAHLVPFGEYVPLKRFLPFVHRLVPAAGDFAPGKDISPLKIPNSPAGVLICYEAIFPEISRIHIQKGAKIIINLTNDAWFGMTSAPYQHLMMSVFRAVESRRVFIRAANTGISAFIDPKGNVVKKGELFNEEILLSKIPTDDHPISIYYRYGDIFVYIALVICLIIFLRGLCYDRLEVGGKRSVF
ncbi:MAG: apolipoprotein N-acyltransferase, partial [Deltaproteobacteria bacterium]|nr:apolipoprotein N-acyltransferase [Deltaproteobacteria bacterium]